ncbi:aldolase [Pholiota conissans]|uniref:Fructose-bisphosphate aldolase n=1 Tax=Pholiota conissans TaxID=109636 RepID=A0A9P6D7I5_9AGAR|nr:aldolase [Pholiota conissans]
MSETIYSTPHNLFCAPDIHPEINQDQISGHGDIKVFLAPFHSHYDAHELIATATALVNPHGKGIYATDEAPDVIDTLLVGAGEYGSVPPKSFSEEELEERRKKWRQAVYEAAPSNYISGVILHPEALLSFNLAPILASKGIIPGVRANGELAPIPRSEADSEFIVQGLDDLLSKLQAARATGARFAKWRSPIACSSTVDVGSKVEGGRYPSALALEIQAETLAQFAAVSQQAGLVPIVEPDVDFSRDADLARSAEVHERIISMTYERMRAHGVLLEGSLLKPSFPQPGLQHPSRANITPNEIALATATVISRSVPPAVPGVLFLSGTQHFNVKSFAVAHRARSVSSGGLSSATATAYLAALNALVLTSAPTSPFKRLPPLTFSYGRAIQGEAMKLWVRGDDKGARAGITERAKACYHAARGEILDTVL